MIGVGDAELGPRAAAIVAAARDAFADDPIRDHAAARRDHNASALEAGDRGQRSIDAVALLEVQQVRRVARRRAHLHEDASVRRVILDGFKVALGRDGADDDFLSIFHGTHFVLVDAEPYIP